jgi:hypothetical protein
MFLNFTLMKAPAEPVWELFILLLVIPVFLCGLWEMLKECEVKRKDAILDIISVSFVIGALCVYGLFFNIKRQKAYDEWYKSYQEEVVYDKIYSFDLNSSVFVIGCDRYSQSTDIRYNFYVEKKDEPGAYELIWLPEGHHIYLKEVEKDFNVTAVKRENSREIEYYINIPKGSFTVPIASIAKD